MNQNFNIFIQILIKIVLSRYKSFPIYSSIYFQFLYSSIQLSSSYENRNNNCYHKITMSRLVPWRNKPTNLITQMIPVASQMKLYLVNQIGPTSFLFKDQNENKFKVVIGSKISCSCGIVQNDHCIHTLYVLLKKYKVSQTNPIIWQASYIDSQLEGLIQLKFMQKKKKQNVSNYRPKKKYQNNLQQSQEFPPLEEDANCPICYEDMLGQCYSTCGTCKKSIHSKCLKVWAKHKSDHNQPVTCPMCRSQFQNALLMVMSDLERWEKRFTVHKGTLCKTCGVKNIKGLIYKCLLCPNTDLCKLCYEGNQHIQHDKYFVKEMSNEGWKIAPIRIKKTRQQLFQMIKQIQTKDLPSNIQSSQFILSLFPSIKQYNGTQNIQELGIVGNQILMKQICYKCRNIGEDSMKRLNCGHSVHPTCLKAMVQTHDFLCEVDQEPICPGYLSAMGIKVKPNKKAVMADVAFMRVEQQKNKIKERMGVQNIGFSLGSKVQRLNQRTKEQNKFNAKSKDKNFRIMKKTIMQRRAQIDQIGVGVGFGSPMMIMGLNAQNTSSNLNSVNIPKPSSQIGGNRNRTLPRPH